ncbi:MAG TPA: YdeI/OmpD-associated family protein [Thermoanaerobaculia bacterium]|nr:YdeI/OmpD-associated family protein [Thermoanaerobaculia bacterium]
MKNTDPRIDSFIAKSAGFAKPILRHLRKLVHEACPDCEETLKWSAPTFMYAGRIMCGMAAFKEHCAFIFWHQGMEKVLGPDGDKSVTAMGSLGRITSLEDLPSDKKMIGYLRKAAALNESGTPARPRPKKRPAARLVVPEDLAAGLKKNKAAAATFEEFSPSHRKEYIEWITEARRDETRQKRLSTTLAWLAEGKSRNWKYENC